MPTPDERGASAGACRVGGGGALTPEDRETLVGAFDGLEPLAPGLAARLARYVETGEGPDSVRDLDALGPSACPALGLKSHIHRRAEPPDERPAWRRWLDGPRRHDPATLLRLVKVVTAPPPSQPHNLAMGRVFHIDPSMHLRPLGAPEWLEPVLWEFMYRRRHSFTQPFLDSRLSAALVVDLLVADGFPAELIYRPAFPLVNYGADFLALTLLGGLIGYGEELAKHPEIVAEALSRAPAGERVRALEMFQAHGLPAGAFAGPLAGLAVCPARKVREVAGPLLDAAGAAALPPLRALAGSGSTEQRLHAAEALGRLGTPEALAVLRARWALEVSARVKTALDGWLSAPAGDDGFGPALPDVFRGVALPGATKDALDALARSTAAAIAAGNCPQYFGAPVPPVGPESLEQGVARLVEPTPWEAAPDLPPWPALRWADPDAFLKFLRRPELTVLHAVRLLALVGDLRVDHHGTGLIYFDYETPLNAYRKAHDPPPDLRALGAAFRASALDPLLIARQRLQAEGFRRFDWPGEAVWPYFAEHLDWLEAAFAASPARRFDYGLGTTSQRRQEVLTILAMFPTPPLRFHERLWGVALGGAKAERPLAQRCLEKLPGHAEKVLAALASGPQAARVAAAGWAARLRPPGLADALRRALETETNGAARDALLDALGAVGARPEPSAPVPAEPGDAGPRADLEAEARKGLRSGVPAGLGWFPFDALPAVRWRGDGAAVGREALLWLVVQAWKAKSPEPGAALRLRAPLLRDDDARALADFVLDAWLAHDLRPPSEDQLKERTEKWAFFSPTTAATPADQAAIDRFRAYLDEQLAQPAGTGLADKGVLALAAACGAPSAAAKGRAYLDRWYGNRVHSCRALVQMLAWVDRPDAVEVLLAVARRFRTRSIRLEAETQARALAERHGCTVAELADRALPDLGLGGDGRLLLDYGGRTFFARLDDDADPVLEDATGRRLTSLPGPNKADDPGRVAQAKAALAEFRKQARGVKKAVADRLYEAMCTQRGWRFAEWRATFQAHPLAGRLCRRLVWSAEGGPTFRPLEDGTFTDLEDAEVCPDPAATVRLAHALTVPEADAGRWRAHLADYEVRPLFDQFPPSPFRLPDTRRGETRIEAALAAPVTREALLRATRGRGYDPLAFRPEDGGDRQVKHFPGAGLQATLDLGFSDEEGPAVSLTLSFHPSEGAGGGRSGRRPRPLGEVPPVLLSECRADLMALAGRPDPD